MSNREKERLERILRGFTEVSILVVGDIMMDRFIRGRVSRISPEAPVPVVVVEKEDFLLGGAANVVNNIHSLGGRGSLCGVIGDDEMGQQIKKELTGKGVDTRGVFVEPGRQTTVKTRIIAHHPHYQQLVRIDRETTDELNRKTCQSLSRFLRESIDGFDGVILSDYGKGLLTRELIRVIIQEVKASKKPILVDPKLKNFFLYKGATVVTPNMQEASEASGISIADETSLIAAGMKLLKKLRCNALVITRGEKGMTIFEPDATPYPVPTVAKEVYDVTGAGDTVIGTMALALGTGVRVDVKDAAVLANHAAGIVVGKVGTATANRDELMRAIKGKTLVSI
jgi:D-glycero-beta-D-manno-heptose-7-phosphate kinase